MSTANIPGRRIRFREQAVAARLSLDAVRAGVIASCSSRVTRYARLASRGPFQKEHAALYSLYGNESDLAEAVLLVARLTQAARFHTYIYNVMPPVLAAFLFLRA